MIEVGEGGRKGDGGFGLRDVEDCRRWQRRDEGLELGKRTRQGLWLLLCGRGRVVFEKDDPYVKASWNVQVDLLLSSNYADESVDLADQGLEFGVSFGAAAWGVGGVSLGYDYGYIKSGGFFSTKLFAERREKRLERGFISCSKRLLVERKRQSRQ